MGPLLMFLCKESDAIICLHEMFTLNRSAVWMKNGGTRDWKKCVMVDHKKIHDELELEHKRKRKTMQCEHGDIVSKLI